MEGAGGLMSTIQDMHKWFLTVRARRILQADSWEQLFTLHIPSGETSFYGVASPLSLA